jgi:hypothetical protein
MSTITSETLKKLSGSKYEQEQLRRDLTEIARRECESMRVYEPLPYQEEFHRCDAQQCLVQKGNRTGATLSLMVEIARAVMGQDPHGKYPKEDGKAVILVYGEKHVGRVVYNGLFKSGHFRGFRLIRDLETKLWRTYRPWSADEGGDLERYEESVPHGPLIPKRYIKGKIAWEKYSERVFSLIRFTSGWELYGANSAGDPGQFQGMSINLYAIDEDLATKGWYEEALGRVIDVNGLIRWTALPHAKNDDMMELIALAEKEKANKKPAAVIIRASIMDNRFISQEKREETLRSWASQGEDVYRKRVHGDLSMTSVLMYPTFHRRLHDVMNLETVVEDRKLLAASDGAIPKEWTAQRVLAARNGEPPDDWTRYVSIDPGYNICAIMFLAVPPPEQYGECVFLYDECYLHEVHSWHFGEAMQAKCASNTYEAFIMDFHGGRLRGIASGDVPIEKYTEALKQRGIRSETTGYSFTPGCDDRRFREEVMRNHLVVNRNGRSTLMVVAARCPSFVQEMEKFRKKTIRQRNKDIPIDEGDRRAGTHAIEAVEQAIANGLAYVKPRSKALDLAAFDTRFNWAARQQARIEKGRRAFSGGGNSITLGPLGVH